MQLFIPHSAHCNVQSSVSAKSQKMKTWGTCRTAWYDLLWGVALCERVAVWNCSLNSGGGRNKETIDFLYESLSSRPKENFFNKIKNNRGMCLILKTTTYLEKQTGCESTLHDPRLPRPLTCLFVIGYPKVSTQAKYVKYSMIGCFLVCIHSVRDHDHLPARNAWMSIFLPFHRGPINCFSHIINESWLPIEMSK